MRYLTTTSTTPTLLPWHSSCSASSENGTSGRPSKTVHPGSRSTLLLRYASLRVNGVMFLMPRLVSPELLRAFAVPTACGDRAAVILAILAPACIRAETAIAVPMVPKRAARKVTDV